MKTLSFPTIKLGEHIKQIKLKVKNTELNQADLTVYGVTNTAGVSITNNKVSDDLGNYIVLNEHQFAYNPYRINVGSIGLTPKGTFGIVSPAYVVFETDEHIDSEFLLYYLKSSIGINLIKWYGDRGGVRAALRYSDLEKINFPSISLEKQLSILSKIKKIESKLELIVSEMANGDVGKLRQSILQQAVEGKLCEQNSDDEPASVLLEKIKKEKDKLVREGKIKKQKDLLPISDEEKPFELPNGWEWCRLGEVLIANEYGTSEKAHIENRRSIPVLRMNNISINGKVNYNELKYISEDSKSLPNLYLQKGDILFNRTNSYELVGKTGLFMEESNKYTFASYLIRLRTIGVDFQFIYLCMNSFYYRKTQIEPSIVQQNGQANFNGTKVAYTLIPIPPLQEQQRIVEKVDELMLLCDELENEVNKAQQYESQLMESVLQEAFSSDEQDGEEKQSQTNKVIPIHPKLKPELRFAMAARGNIKQSTLENLQKRAIAIVNGEK